MSQQCFTKEEILYAISMCEYNEKYWGEDVFDIKQVLSDGRLAAQMLRYLLTIVTADQLLQS
jgi:hypothetical protein